MNKFRITFHPHYFFQTTIKHVYSDHAYNENDAYYEAFGNPR